MRARLGSEMLTQIFRGIFSFYTRIIQMIEFGESARCEISDFLFFDSTKIEK